MNLLLQLLPYTLFAAFTSVATGFYLFRSSQSRRGRWQAAAVQVSSGAPFRPESGVAHSDAGTRVTNAAQILRLSELGIAPGQIASALGVPLQEVELMVRFEQVRPDRPGFTKSAGQLS